MDAWHALEWESLQWTKQKTLGLEFLWWTLWNTVESESPWVIKGTRTPNVPHPCRGAFKGMNDLAGCYITYLQQCEQPRGWSKWWVRIPCFCCQPCCWLILYPWVINLLLSCTSCMWHCIYPSLWSTETCFYHDAPVRLILCIVNGLSAFVNESLQGGSCRMCGWKIRNVPAFHQACVVFIIVVWCFLFSGVVYDFEKSIQLKDKPCMFASIVAYVSVDLSLPIPHKTDQNSFSSFLVDSSLGPKADFIHLSTVCSRAS